MSLDQPLPRPNVISRRAVHVTLRWALWLTLVATSVGQALDVPGFREVLRAYDLVPAWSLWFVAVAMPLAKALIALSMLTGWRLRQAVFASVLVHGSFAAILALELLRGVHLDNCGCFGVFLARPLRCTSPIEELAEHLCTHRTA